jgi:hypothetical protein
MPYLYDPEDSHINQALNTISVKYKNDATIWRDVMPVAKVEKLSDFYYVWDESTDFNQTDDTLSAVGNRNEILMKNGQDVYACRPYGLGAWIPVALMENADDPLKPLSAYLENVKTQLDNRQEVRVANTAFTAATYATGFKATLSGTSQWSDYTNSDPINAILTALDACLQRPNTVVLGADTWRVLRQHPKLLASIFPLGGNAIKGGVATSEGLQALLSDEGVDKVVIGRRRVNTANIGQATPVLSRAWGKHCALLYVAPTPSLEMASFGYSIMESESLIVRDFDKKRGSKGSEYIGDGWTVDVKITAQKSGYFFENAVV